MSSLRPRWLLLAAALCAGLTGFWLAHQLDRGGPQLASGTWLPQSKAVIDFQLTDTSGRGFSRRDLLGAPTLVFFGFTHCPDICPVELQTMTTALDQLGAAADKVTPVFITVDPARDTPQVMGEFVANFHPRLVALTGSEAEVGAVARHFRVYYAKATGGTASSDPNDYIMDHTAIVYLIGPDGGYLSHFEPGTSADEMAAALREYL